MVGGATNDLVNVTGNLTLGGTLSVNAPSAGYYRLFNYGTLTPSNFDTINGSSNGTPTVLTNVPNQVNLLIAAAGQRIQFWDGADQTGNGVVNGGTGTWNAANTNWTGAPGQAGINDPWRSSVGVFAGTAGTVTIAGTQAFDTLQFSTTGYVLNAGAGGQLQLAGLSGTGTINTDNGVVATIDAPIVNGSSTSLTKVGGGTLILTGANTYSGGTTISRRHAAARQWRHHGIDRRQCHRQRRLRDQPLRRLHVRRHDFRQRRVPATRRRYHDPDRR